MNPVRAMFLTTDQSFPAGTVAAGFLLTLTEILPPDATAEPKVVTALAAIDAREITIADVPAGVYSGSIALVDAENRPLAEPVIDPAPLTVIEHAETITIAVPSSLTLTLP